MAGPGADNPKLVNDLKSSAIDVSVRAAINVIKDAYNYSEARERGQTFDEFLAGRRELARFKSSPHYSLTVSDVKQGLADSLSSTLRPVTFAACDGYDTLNKAVNKAAADAASTLLRSLGFS